VELRNRTARPLPQLNGRTPYKILTGNTPDISEFLEFGWYQLVWYNEPQVFPNQTRLPARWLGVAHRVGQAMCYWLLPESGVLIARTTIKSISNEELATTEVKHIIDAFNDKLISKLGEIQGNTINDSPTFNLYKEDEDPQDLDFEQELFDPDAAQVDVDDIDNEVFDELLLNEPVLHRDGQLIRAKVMGRKRDNNGRVIGKYNPNPLLNSAVYLVEFPDGHIQELGANALIEAIYNQIDKVGNNEVLFRDIIGHRCDSTLRENSEVRVNNRTVTTQGWEVCVSWQDGSTSWHPMTDIKYSKPVPLAKYAIENKLQDLPAFYWWVKYVIKNESRLIKAVKSCYSQRSHKFEIYVPKTVEEALKIDQETNTTTPYKRR
jgi:hypothetical protein